MKFGVLAWSLKCSVEEEQKSWLYPLLGNGSMAYGVFSMPFIGLADYQTLQLHSIPII